MRDTLILDVRYALRQAWKNPSYTIAAFLALALGLGATTAMFTLVNGVLLRPLRVRDESRLVSLNEIHTRTGSDLKVSMTDFLDWQTRLKSFSGLALYRLDQANRIGTAEPERLRILVSGTNLLSVLGVVPARGRNFSPEQSQPNRANEALLSWDYWKQRFGGRDVLGQHITLDDKPYTIVGVLPDMPVIFGEEDVWLPLTIDITKPLNDRGHHAYYAVGRLRPDVSLSTANRELRALAASLAVEYPRENSTVRARLISLRESVTGQYRLALWLLFGFVFTVLVIACVNVASLSLARAASRQREVSIRIAVGASSLRVFRQVLTESLLLSCSATLAGVALAFSLVGLVKRLPALRIPLAENIQIDWRVLLFSSGIALLTGLGFGLAPAVTASFTRVNDALKQASGRTTESRSQHRLKRWFVFLQSALAALLLVIAGLLLRSFVVTSHIDPGFNPHHLLTLNVSLPSSRFGTAQPGKIGAFVRAALENIGSIPGIQQAAIASDLPLIATGAASGVLVEKEPQTSIFNAPYAQLTRISPGYFGTMRIPFLSGRDFEERDRQNTTPVAIVNSAFVRDFLHGRNALNERIAPAADPSHYREIIGVVADVPQLGIEKDPIPQVFFSINQLESGWLAIVVRTQDDPMSYVPRIRSAVQKVDPAIAVFLPRTMQQIISQQRGWRGFESTLVGAFALVALLMAGLGTYAVISYSIAQRVGEIGIRMALGATKMDVLNAFTIQGAMPAVFGGMTGMLAGFAVARVTANMLYGVGAADLTTYLAAIGLFLLIAMVASLIPAQRAASLDPSLALRYE